MTVPFYVAPEQVMKDRADYARKGIARGRAMVAVRYADGMAMVAENSSATLRKISEIYDRIAFAGVGRYNEFDQLRVAGVRAADLKGYQYSRDDVDARSLANQYAQILGQIFTHEMKPMEVEILVAEVGHTPEGDQMFHINYDGTVFDERDYAVLGGDSATISTRFTEAAGDRLGDGFELGDAVRAAVTALAGPDRTLQSDDLEVALLVRGESRRCFRRLTDEEIGALLGEAGASPAPAATRLRRSRGGRPQQRRRRVLRGVDGSATTRRCCASCRAPTWRAGSTAATRRRCGRRARRRRRTASRSAPRCRTPTSPGSAGGSSTSTPTSCATPCSTSSAPSTPSPRSPAARSTTSSRTARCTTPRSTTSPRPRPSSPRPPSTTRRWRSSASRTPSCSPPPSGPGWRRCRRASSTAPTDPTAGSCRAPRPGAVITDVDAAVAQAVRLAVDGEVVAVDGEVISLHARSLCVHGDTPGAVALATAAREALEAAGVGVLRVLRLTRGDPPLRVAGAARDAAATSARHIDHPDVVEVVPGAETVLVVVGDADAARCRAATRLMALEGAMSFGPVSVDGLDREVVLDVVYDGDDLVDVAELPGSSIEDVVAAPLRGDLPLRLLWVRARVRLSLRARSDGCTCRGGRRRARRCRPGRWRSPGRTRRRTRRRRRAGGTCSGARTRRCGTSAPTRRR